MSGRKILILLILLFAFPSIFPNDVIHYFSETKKRINNQVLILEDTSTLFTINDILDQQLFQDSTLILDYNNALTFSDGNFWVHFSLINDNAFLKNIIFEIGNSGLDYVRLFVVNNKLIRHTKPTGDQFNFHTRQILSRNFVYELALEPEEQYDIYVLLNCGNDAAKIPMHLYAPSYFTQKVQFENTLFGLYYGIIFAIILILITALLFRHKMLSLVYLILYIAFIVLFLLNFDGLGFQFLYPGLPWFTNIIEIIVPILAIFFVFRFIFEYINLPSENTFYYRFFNYFNYGILIVIPLSFFTILSHKTLIILLLIIGFLSILFITYAFVKSYKYNVFESRVIALSFLCLILVIAGFYLRIFTHFDSYLFEGILIKTGFILQFIILTFALMINLKALQDKAQREAVNNLIKLNELKEKSNQNQERVIKEKTRSLHELNQKLKKAIIQNSNINTKLHQQKIEITKQKEEIENKNTELSEAFHQISSKNEELEQKNEEIHTQKDKIESQKNIIERRNKDINSSINYAKRIQHSIFPSEKHLQSLVKDSFVYYNPKEAIGGDLYWFEEFPPSKYLKLSREKISKKLIISAIDCTGHGIPGALMSIVARDLLDKAINENGITKPSDILDSMHQGVLSTFRKNIENEHISDGMDMALCTIERDTNEMQFAGANNPVWIIRNGEIHQIRGDVFSIGTLSKSLDIKFTNHNYQLEKGDCVYLFSDGYPDQFGGPHLKKFKFKNFKQLILDIHQLTMPEQKKILVDRFEKWMGNVEQTDDVLVIGFKI